MFGVLIPFNENKSLVGQFLLIFVMAALLHLFANVDEAYDIAQKGELGGIIGYYISQVILVDFLAKSGAFIVLIILLFISLPLSFALSLTRVAHFIGQVINKIREFINKSNKKLSSEEQDNLQPQESEDLMVGDLNKDKITAPPNIQNTSNENLNNDINPESYDHEGEKITHSVGDSTQAMVNVQLKYPDWKFFPNDLLNPYEKRKTPQEDIKKNSDIIEQTLGSFGVKARVVDVMSGPTVTEYALNIALGTKVSRIANLRTDLALALAAPTGSVRIEAPIPGTSYIGIEIPNTRPDTVFIRELIESKEFKDNKLELGVVVGKNVSGKNIITDIQKMPHLLIAGATGSGKSILMNAFIMSLLKTKTPDELKMIMVDPKQVELSDYNDIPYLLTPVITDMQKVINSLKWAMNEMEQRYTLFRESHVRNLVGYNKMMGYAALPYIIIIIDEMADLMLTAGAEIESAVVRLAQKARATGIHLLLATQRPSVDVITGLIKANIPGRIGMSVATQIDSRVILDQVGSESLLGKGDMLFKEPDKSKPYRVQGVLVTPDEVQRVVEFIKSQTEKVEYRDEVTKRQTDPLTLKAMGDSAGFSDDELFADSVRIVVNAKKGSASLLQRKLSIGYNRAARLLDELQKYGVVGAQEGSKPRKILISDPEEFLKKSKDEENNTNTP